MESEAEEATDEEESDYEKGYKREIHKKDD